MALIRSNQFASLARTRFPNRPHKHVPSFAESTRSITHPESISSTQASSRVHITRAVIVRQPLLCQTNGMSSRQYSTHRHAKPRQIASKPPEPIVHPIFEPSTGTFQYIVADPSSKACAIIDPVLDFDPCTSRIRTTSADALLALIAEKSYGVHCILETHAHADHLSAASYIQAKLSKSGTRPEIGIGQRIGQVQELFGRRYDIPAKEYDLVFDHLFSDDEVFHIGNMQAEAIHLPGHTPDHMGYRIGCNVFCGDSLFHTDIGTARTDFPGGSALDLWESSQKLLALPDETRIWMGHDYPPEGRKPAPFMTVKQHKESNKHVMTGRSRDEFVEMRKRRDAALGAPRLLHQSLQINVRGGKLPQVDESGRRKIVVPLQVDRAESW